MIQRSNGDANKLFSEDRPVHDWYRFVLSFSPHLVRNYLDRFSVCEDQIVLDPFCGTGTTLVECKKLNISSVGIEGNPMAHFASQVKTDWSPDSEKLLANARMIADEAKCQLSRDGLEDESSALSSLEKIKTSTIRTMPEEAFNLLLSNSISPLPLHKALVLLECIEAFSAKSYCGHARLALAKSAVSSFSNLHFGPEVGVTKPKEDAPVVSSWLDVITAMSTDLKHLYGTQSPSAKIYRADSRHMLEALEPHSVHAVITSPPYPNEKDYTRTTRLESVLLGFLQNKRDLRALKQYLVRSNTRNVYKWDYDDRWIEGNIEVQRLAKEIEARRIELNKTSGFERLYATVTKLYFGGMKRHLADLRYILHPGAKLAYVVGDQASYFRVMIRTGEILAGIAEELGYKVIGIDLFRTRLATATREQLREEVVVLEWPGKSKTKGGYLLPEEELEMEHPVSDEASKNRYIQLIETIFQERYQSGMTEVDFKRTDIEDTATKLKIKLPKNLGDVVYSFRYRSELPKSIQSTASEGQTWIIRPTGRSLYRFVQVPNNPLRPNPMLGVVKIPDATPGIISKYAFGDEQSLLVKLRYNRLIDIFTGVTCYSLQNHLRTTVPDMGQVETDEVYVGIDRNGAHYVFPVQAKGGKDQLNIVQIEQDYALCKHKFPNMICHPIGVQFMANDRIAIFSFQVTEENISLATEKHYQLVTPDQITPAELDTYRNTLPRE